MKFERLTAFRNKKLALIIEPLLSPGDKILDFGCGDGNLAFRILNQCRNRGKSIEMTGFDPFEREKFIPKFNSLSEVRLFSPDVVLLIDVVHHIHPAAVETLGELLSYLSPGTRLIIKDVIIKENLQGWLQFKENLFLDRISMFLKKAEYQFSSYYTYAEFCSFFEKLGLEILDYQEVKIEPILFNSSGLFILRK